MKVDRAVVVRGAAGGLLIAMLAALANVILAAQHPVPKGALNATLLGLLAGFFLAGFVAGYEARREPARHGAYAALVAFVPVEIVGLLGRLDRGDPVSIFGIVLVAFLAAAAGLGGASFGAKRRLRTIEKRSADPGGTPS